MTVTIVAASLDKIFRSMTTSIVVASQDKIFRSMTTSIVVPSQDKIEIYVFSSLQHDVIKESVVVGDRGVYDML